MRYVTLDFETANSSRISPCSIGLARMEDGEVLETYYSLINPPSAYFDPFNISIHGIHSEDIKGAPSFRDLWPDILLFIGYEPLLAHNAQFDMGILRAMLEHYNLKVAPLHYSCTVRISRKVWPHLPSHRLVDLSSLFNFDYRAHDALEDAINCGKIFFETYRELEKTSRYHVEQFLLERGIQFQRLNGGLAPLTPENAGQNITLF